MSTVVVSLFTARWPSSGLRCHSITLRFSRNVDVDHAGEAWASQRSNRSATVPAPTGRTRLPRRTRSGVSSRGSGSRARSWSPTAPCRCQRRHRDRHAVPSCRDRADEVIRSWVDATTAMGKPWADHWQGDAPIIPTNHEGLPAQASLGADDGTRTRDPHLGKVMRFVRVDRSPPLNASPTAAESGSVACSPPATPPGRSA
jgi:hypothetical protein